MPKSNKRLEKLYEVGIEEKSTEITKKQTSHSTSDTRNLNHKVPILSFFTGAGLLDLGFMNNGFEVVWRNEFNRAFARGFEHAMSVYTGGDSHKINNTSSIAELTADQVIEEAFSNSSKPSTFGIIGGPPCTDFSNAGKHHGGAGINGKLALIYINLILQIKPAFFVLENVKGLFENRKHKDFLNKLIKDSEDLYLTDAKVLNALDYGIPQNRERGFLVGFRRDWLEENTNFNATNLNHDQDSRQHWFPWPKVKYTNPKELYKWPSKTEYGGDPIKPAKIPQELMIGTYICDPKIDLTLMPNGKDHFVAKSGKFTEILEGDDTRKSFKRLHRWRFSPTAAYGNNEVHLHPSLPRRLSVREVMKIQSVPDNYELPDTITLTHKYKMIGNGVPVKLAETLANSFVQVLNKTFDFKTTSINSITQGILFSNNNPRALPNAHEDDNGQTSHNGLPATQISAVKSSNP